MNSESQSVLSQSLRNDLATLATRIGEWIAIDEELKQLREKQAQRRQLSESIVKTMQSKGATVLKTNVGTIQLVETNEFQGLTFKYLEKCLSEIISNRTQVEQILAYVRSQRPVNRKVELRR